MHDWKNAWKCAWLLPYCATQSYVYLYYNYVCLCCLILYVCVYTCTHVCTYVCLFLDVCKKSRPLLDFCFNKLQCWRNRNNSSSHDIQDCSHHVVISHVLPGSYVMATSLPLEITFYWVFKHWQPAVDCFHMVDHLASSLPLIQR